MRIGPESERATAISASNPETIVVRGHDLAGELIGKVGFTDYAWLLVAGALPTEGQRRVLDATLVAIAEHGLTPSVQAARMTLAAAPEALQGAVAAGLLGCGSVILGSSEQAGRFFAEIREAAAGGDLAVAALAATRRLHAAGRPIPGYGHPLHKARDARAVRLVEIAREAGLAGDHIRIAELVEGFAPEVTGKALKMNVSGAIPAVLLDAGYPLLALKGAPLLARTAGLIGHLLEEQARPVGFALAQAGAAAVRYDGPAPAGFVADEG